MTSCIGAVVSEELLSIFMVVQEESSDCFVDEGSKLFGNVAYIHLYIASYSRTNW
jgi:predicted histidine transporter YuiF (NhaC family)